MNRCFTYRSLLIAIIALVGAFFCSGSYAAIAENGKLREAEIRAVLSSQVAAWNRGDIDGFMNGYARSEATEFISGGKITRGWQTVRDRYKKKYDSREKMGQLTFSNLKIQSVNRDATTVSGAWRLVRKSDNPHGRFTLQFRRTPGGWRIVRDQTS